MAPSSNSLFGAAAAGAVGAFGIALGAANAWIKAGKDKQIFEPDDGRIADLRPDAIVVLGARIRPGGQPSAMLEDRLLTASDLWRHLHDVGVNVPLIVTGTDGRDGQVAETGVMMGTLLRLGVPESSLEVDPAGVSTLDSATNLAERFPTLVVVSQRFHLPRVLFNFETVAREGRRELDVRGVVADRRPYSTALKASTREAFASLKDAALALRNQTG